ncbi:hypothetical protein Tco_0116613 [Tanacetum coccineum]
MKHSYSKDDRCFSIDVIDEIFEEDFDALLDEGSKILHSIKGTLLKEEIFSKFDEFMAMSADENFESESDTKEPPFEKITINTGYKINTYLEEPPTDLELKPLPDNLEYVFLEEPSFLPVIISSKLSAQNNSKLISVLKKHKEAFAWKTTDIPEVVKKEIVKLLDTSIIYPIADSPWVSPIHCVLRRNVTSWSKKEFCLDTKCLAQDLKLTTKNRRNLKTSAPTNIKGVRSFLGHAGFYRRFIKDYSKIARPLTKLLEKDTPFEFKDECQKEFESWKEKLTCAPVIMILLLQEFDIEINDRKGTKSVAADHLSRIENDESSDVDDNFTRETLMEINTKDEPWITRFIANYLVADIIPKG